MLRIRHALITVLVSLVATETRALSLEEQMATFKAVGSEGKGNGAAAEAWKQVVASGPESILPLLRHMKDASPMASNWIRSAITVIHEKTSRDTPDQVPLEGLSQFVTDRTQSAAARELGFDLIESTHAEKALSMKPGFLDDPSPELRRRAVSLLISQGKTELASGGMEKATQTFETALQAARNVDQIREITKILREKAGKPVDVPALFGFLMDWQIIGPFHNTDRTGFETVFPPEETAALIVDSTYPGKTREVRWQPYSTNDDYGMVNFNTPYDPLKEVTAYAYADFQSDSERPAELRLGCKNAWKIWVNGEYLFGRDEYHRGARIDQYIIPIHLKKGSNSVLIKVCQDEQVQDWTKEWQFQIRVCDSTGTAILASNRKPSSALSK